MLQYRLPGPAIRLEKPVAFNDVYKILSNADYKIVGEIADSKELENVYFGDFPRQPTRAVVVMKEAESGIILLIDKDQVFGISVYEEAPTEIEQNHGNNVRAFRVLQLLDAGGFADSIRSYRHNLKVEEERTIKTIRDPNKPKEVERIQAAHLQRFFDAKDAVLIVNDHHTETAPLKTLEALAKFPEVTWIGLELSARYGKMFSSGNQDRELYLLEEPIKPGDQRREIMHRRISPAGEFYSTWRALRKIQETTQKPIHFLDTDEYMLTGKDMLGLLSLVTGVRNNWMAKQIPETGRGVILIGQGHIDYPLNINLQDFIFDRFPDRKVFVLE